LNKDILKVHVKDGCELEFEEYCEDHGIFCRVFPSKALKTVYRAECKAWELNGAEKLIKSIEDMPIMKLS
jgi:hypothetical protein